MRKRDDFASATIVNPKRYADAGGAQEARLFPYYVGYSAAFASTLLASLDLADKPCILDPWNGSGITTHTARRFGYKTIGQDLNPVMVLVAKAELLSPQDAGRLIPLARDILDKARRQGTRAAKDDPLCHWLAPTTASFMRAIEIEINNSLVYVNKKAKLVSRFVEFYIQLLEMIKEDMLLVSQYEKPKHPKVLDGFQKYVLQASVEPYSIKRRDAFLKAEFARFKP